MQINSTIFQLKKIIGDIKNYNKEWHYTHDFQKLIGIMNKCTNDLSLPSFKFETFHYSSSGKTINPTGYESLLNHIKVLEEMIPMVSVSPQQSNVVKEEKKVAHEENTKVFIVHGRDKTALLETEGIVRRAGLEPIVLSRMTNSGLTLIEKFEKHSNVKYAIVLLTPDDIGALNENAPLESLNFKFRARQNVIFELGFFYGKLGRASVSCIYKSTVELPTDINGVAYLPYTQSVDELEFSLLKELKEADIEVKVF
ncbi:nucleotide-binding protein [Bacillus sp. ISL-53]|nr:nucleotide-binding protein [Bacillus sp. ISL-53]